GGPKGGELDRLAEEPDRERHEDRERDDFLKDLELSDVKFCVADTVGRHLEQILEQGDAPAYKSGDVPSMVIQAFEVPVPGKGHEDIGSDKQQGCFCENGQVHNW